MVLSCGVSLCGHSECVCVAFASGPAVDIAAVDIAAGGQRARRLWWRWWPASSAVAVAPCGRRARRPSGLAVGGLRRADGMGQLWKDCVRGARRAGPGARARSARGRPASGRSGPASTPRWCRLCARRRGPRLARVDRSWHVSVAALWWGSSSSHVELESDLHGRAP